MNVTITTVNWGKRLKLEPTSDSMSLDTFHNVRCDHRCANVVLWLKMFMSLHFVLIKNTSKKYLTFL